LLIESLCDVLVCAQKLDRGGEGSVSTHDSYDFARCIIIVNHVFCKVNQALVSLLLLQNIVEIDSALRSLPVFFEVNVALGAAWIVCEETLGEAITRAGVCKCKNVIALVGQSLSGLI